MRAALATRHECVAGTVRLRARDYDALAWRWIVMDAPIHEASILNQVSKCIPACSGLQVSAFLTRGVYSAAGAGGNGDQAHPCN
jgi:hypothetical protein